MPAHISLITLGVADVAKSTAFYEQLGFVRSKKASQESVSFFQAGPLVLALWGRDAQRDDARAAELWTGNGGIVVAQNLASEDAVDVMMARAEAAGARMLKEAAKTFWGGYNGYFADPDGHASEEHLDDVLRHTAQSGREAPHCKPGCEDDAAVAAVGKPRDGNGKDGVEEGEGGPAEPAELRISQAEIMLDRLREDADDLAIDEVQRVGDDQQRHQHAAVALQGFACVHLSSPNMPMRRLTSLSS